MKFNEQITAKQYRNNWKDNYNFNILKNPVKDIIENIKNLERKNMFTNEMILFFDNKKFVPLYITQNIETFLGYTQKQFLNWGKDALLNIGAFEHTKFWEDITRWHNEALGMEIISEKSTSTFRTSCAGFYYNHNDGYKKKFLARSEYPIGDKKVLPDNHFLRYQDIGHLMKKDGYWLFCEKLNGDKKVSRFYSENSTSDYPISPREKEVLNLIAIGMDSKEIAERLFISLETVKTHRKNMINRLHAKDTSSLIQICKLCEFI